MKITIELTDDELRDLLITAGEQGCGYWARTELNMSEALTRAVKVHDADTGDYLGTLTAAKLRRLVITDSKADGVKAILLGAASFAFDANQADVFVQFVLFGEERYA